MCHLPLSVALPIMFVIRMHISFFLFSPSLQRQCRFQLRCQFRRPCRFWRQRFPDIFISLACMCFGLSAVFVCSLPSCTQCRRQIEATIAATLRRICERQDLLVYCCLAAFPFIVAWRPCRLLLLGSCWRSGRRLLLLGGHAACCCLATVIVVVVVVVVVVVLVLAWRPCRMYVSAAMPFFVDVQLLG